MAEIKSSCPQCGRIVMGRLSSSSATPGMAIVGGLLGLSLGPLGPLVGAGAGAGVGKAVNFVAHRVFGKKIKQFSFKCPTCGCYWMQDEA